MRRSPAVTLLLLLLSVAARAPAAPETPAQATRRLVVALSAYGEGEKATAKGLGFLVAPTLIACDAAVVDAGRAYTVTTHDDRTLEIDGAVRMDAGLESVLLRTAWPQERITPCAFAPELPPVGAALTIIAPDRTIPCAVTAVAKVDDRITITLATDAPVELTGAPVLDAHGTIVGMLAVRGAKDHRTAALIPGKALELIRAAAPAPSDIIRAPGAPPDGDLRTIASAIPSVPRDDAPPPADILDRLSDAHQKLMRDQAQWYIRAPDARCYNAYRALRHMELLERPPQFGRELEQIEGPADPDLGGIDDKGDERIVHENTPDWWEAPEDIIICSGLKQHAQLTPDRRLAEGVWSAVCVGPVEGVLRDILVLDPSGLCLAPDRVVTEPAVAIATGTTNFHGRAWRSYELFRLADLKPTPAQLAWSVCRKKATIVIHTVRTSEHQPKRTVRHDGNYATYRKVINDGPRIITHRWKSTPVTVRFRPESPASAPAPQ